MKRWIFRAGFGLVAALVAIQFVPVARTNSPVEGELPMEADLKT